MEESPETAQRGFGNYDFHTNGEARVAGALIGDDDTVFDVGAYVGGWSKSILERHPKVRLFAFEPAPESYEKLRQNVEGLSVVAEKLALSDSEGTMEFKLYENAEHNSFYSREVLVQQGQAKPGTIDVPTERIDAYCERKGIDHIDYLKLDTEGAELVVLRGASRMLQRKAIGRIQFEYGGTYPDAGITLKEVFGLLAGHGYQLYRVIPTGLLRIASWRPELENYQYSNYLAVLPDSG